MAQEIRRGTQITGRFLTHSRRPDHPRSLSSGARRHRRNPLHLLVQPEAHADQPVQGGVGVDEGVECLVALAVALGLPGADGASALEAGDDALGSQLAEIVGVEAAGEVDRAGAGFGEAQAGVDGVLHRVDADDEQRDLALVGPRRTAGPDRDARPAAALDRPDAASEAGAQSCVAL